MELTEEKEVLKVWCDSCANSSHLSADERCDTCAYFDSCKKVKEELGLMSNETTQRRLILDDIRSQRSSRLDKGFHPQHLIIWKGYIGVLKKELDNNSLFDIKSVFGLQVITTDIEAKLEVV